MISTHALPSLERAQKAAVEFETAFLSQSLQSVFEPMAEEGLFGSGEESNMFISFLAENLAKTIAEGKGVGIAEQILPSLMKDNQQPNIPNPQFLSSGVLASLLHQQSLGMEKGV